MGKQPEQGPKIEGGKFIPPDAADQPDGDDAPGQRTFWNDPALYRRMLEPLPDFEAADTAVQGFNAELRLLREKYRLADVHVVISASVVTDQGIEAPFLLNVHHGDPLRAEKMLAYALGHEQAMRQQEVYGLMSGKTLKTMKRGR